MWFKPQLNKFSVFRIVVVLLCLHPWVWYRYGLHIKPKLLSRFGNKGCKFIYRELLGKLIEDTKLTRISWVCNGKLDALNCISYVKVSPGLYILILINISNAHLSLKTKTKNSKKKS